MRIRSIASSVLALGLSSAIPSVAMADHGRGNRDEARFRDRPVVRYEPRYEARYVPEVCRDFDVNVSLRDVPRGIIDALNCESRGPIDSIQHVGRSGQEFYRFGIGGRRDSETVVRIGANGHLLTVGEFEKCEPGYSRVDRGDHRDWRR